MSETFHAALLHVSATIRRRVETVDSTGDVTVTDETEGPIACHAYQRFRNELVDGQMLGIEELVVHLMADVEVTVGDRLDITWPAGRAVEAEIIGPPARRINARSGKVHHVEVRTRELH